MKSDDNNFVGKFKGCKDCDKYLDLYISHFERDTNNIFTLNNQTEDLLPCLFLSVNILHQLIYSKNGGWLNDYMFNHIVELLNVYE